MQRSHNSKMSNDENAQQQPGNQAQAAAQIIYVHTPGGPDLRIDPFSIPDDPLLVSQAWEEWLLDLEEAMDYYEVNDHGRKTKALKQFGGREIKRLIRTLPEPDDIEDDTEYKKTVRKLNSYFVPKKNKHYALYLFNKLQQDADETVAKYTARLREKAKDCEFEDTEGRILEHLIQTMRNQDLVKRTINQQWTLTQLLAEAGQTEQTNSQVVSMRSGPTPVAKLNSRGRDHFRQRGRGSRRNSRYQQSNQRDQKSGDVNHSDPCGYCGKAGVHPPGKDCPAFGRRCRQCGRYGHFSDVCRGGSYRRPHRGRGRGRPHKAAIRRCPEADTEQEDSPESEEEFLGKAAKHLSINHIEKSRAMKKISKAEWDATVHVEIGGVAALMEPDSGSFANIIDEKQYRALKKAGCHMSEMRKPHTGIKTIQTEIQPIGEFSTVINNKYEEINTSVIVIKGRMDSPPILSRRASEKLGFISIDKEGRLNKIQVSKVSEQQQQVENAFPECFEGIGEIKDKKTNEPMKVHLELEKDAIPIAQKPRHVPYYLVDPLKKWIETGLREGIIEKVPKGEAITWCSPLVVQPKPKFANQEKLEQNQIRACVDMRIINQAMKRSRLVQAPLVEDFAYYFNNCKVYSKLDLLQGYHQLVLDEESRKICTFSTPWGNYRARRLVFGA